MTISLSGLDLSFMKKPDPQAVDRGRFRWSDKAGRLVSVREWHRLHGEPSKLSKKVGIPFFMPDIDAHYGGAWESIIDGSEISSRSNWREHNKRNDVVDVGDKFFSPDGDDVKRTEEIMGYDKSLIGHPDFVWGKQDLD
jgi:hypothetical protein